MPAKPIHIVIDRTQRQLPPGAARGRDVLSLADLASTDRLVLEVQGDIDVPVAPDDLLFIRPGDTFSIADSSSGFDENPLRHAPLEIRINETVVAVPRAKASGSELKSLVQVDGHHDLWADLEGLADQLIEGGDIVMLRKDVAFFTVPKAGEDRMYEVTVLLDGEARERKFPATMSVLEAIKRSLPPADRSDAGKFDMVDSNLGPNPLDHGLDLKSAGVRDGHVLSITKKDGGGGNR